MPLPIFDLLPMERLSPLLADRIGVERIDDIKKTASGQSNPTFVLTTDQGKFVLRRKPAGMLLKSAHAVEREYRVMRALQGHMPVPRMHFLCEDADIIGAPFFVMDFVDGESFEDPRALSLSPDARARIYDAMNAGLAQLHGLDVAALGLSDYGKPGNYFARQLARWSAQYEATQTEVIAPMDELMAWLGTSTPDDDGKVSLVHGDWRIDNLLFDRDTNALKAVLDWELSTLGHPLADLGAQLMQWAMPVGPVGRGLAGVDRAELGIPENDAYVADYERRTERSVPDMTFYVAFAFFRMAAILQGVKKRGLDGNASDPKRAAQLGAYVPILAQTALDRITAAG